MEIVKGTAELAKKHRNEILDLLYSTGPAYFEYMFDGDRDFFNLYFGISVENAGTPYGYDTMSLIMDGDQMIGCLCSMKATEYVDRRTELRAVGYDIVENSNVNPEGLAKLRKRGAELVWLNVAMNEGVYYVIAVTVKPEHRGKGLGVKLVEHAKSIAKSGGFDRLELDVIADNPAVDLYKSVGMQVMVETKAPIPSAHGVPAELRMGMEL
ncbi:MAG: GNAT family N-acetyltransferase [Pseudomonadota bacterium]